MYNEEKIYERSRIVISDSRKIIEEEGDKYEQNGYVVAMMDFVNNQGVGYNPFLGFGDNIDIDIYSRTLIENYHKILTGRKAEEYRSYHLINSLFSYLYECTEQNVQTTNNIIRLIRIANIDDVDTSSKSSIDRLFDAVEKDEPDSFVVAQYHDFRDTTSKHLINETLSECMNIIQSLSPQPRTNYNLETMDTWINIKNILKEKYAVYIIVSPFDKTSIFKAQMFLWQLNCLYARKKAMYEETQLTNRIQMNELNCNDLSIHPSKYNNELYEITSEKLGETYPIAWGNMDYVAKLYDLEKANKNKNETHKNNYLMPEMYAEKTLNQYFDKILGLTEYKKDDSYSTINYYNHNYCFDLDKYKYLSGSEYQQMMQNKMEEMKSKIDTCDIESNNTNKQLQNANHPEEKSIENNEKEFCSNESVQTNIGMDEMDEEIRQISLELEVQKIKACIEKLEELLMKQC